MVLDEKSVLDPIRHKRLLEDFDHICTVANIPPKYIRTSMVTTCDSKEIDWVTNFRLYRDTYPGLVLNAKPNSDERCMAITGALVRNFIDARFMTLTKLLDAAEAHAVPTPTVLVIPNLFQKSYGKQYTAWQLAVIYDVLISRWTASLPTVVAVESLTGLQQAYGLSFSEHLKHYKGAE